MSDLPKCRICKCNYVSRPFANDYVFACSNNGCFMSAHEFTYAEWTALMGRGEPVAWAATDETGLTVESLGFNKSRRFDTPLYLAPQQAPAVDGAVARKNEKRIASDEWTSEFFKFAPDGGWNNFNNWILNDYFKAGISGHQAARHFYSAEL